MPNWTKEQSDAIYKTGTNIIVSAGAGSGKTAVLSERVIEKLKSGIHINELLILTFTNTSLSGDSILIFLALFKIVNPFFLNLFSVPRSKKKGY